jgi:SAM-dependent methyltransferase
MSVWEEERTKQTISLVPENCSSILDVGCGDGRITNRLTSLCSKVAGVDGSREALNHVDVERVLGSVDLLPFGDKSFDLVLCCEVLEHLPFGSYPRAVEEVQRVAAKSIIVTVPSNEHLEESLITCPHCGCKFHQNRHVRSFTPQVLTYLFGQFHLQAAVRCLRLKVRTYPGFLIKGAQSLHLLPANPFPMTALCPQCGYSALLSGEAYAKTEAIGRERLAVRVLRSLARRLTLARERDKLLMALYERN